jgi:hypothetical protein
MERDNCSQPKIGHAIKNKNHNVNVVFPNSTKANMDTQLDTVNSLRVKKVEIPLKFRGVKVVRE